jgi:bifunctional ADP-heptose synthase (sugar kinase/adenylyltransferase)
VCCLVTADEHVNNNRAIARQPPVTTLEGLLVAVFSVGSVPRLYSENPRPVECSSVQAMKRRLGGWCEMAANLAVFSCESRVGS